VTASGMMEQGGERCDESSLINVAEANDKSGLLPASEPPAEEEEKKSLGDNIEVEKELFSDVTRLSIQQKWHDKVEGNAASQYYTLSNADTEVELFRIEETSKNIERLCCSVYRELTLHVNKIEGGEKDVLSFKKSHHFCCFSPTLIIEQGKEMIGTVKNSQVMEKEKCHFTTEASLCRLGLWCTCCAGVVFKMRRHEHKEIVAAKVERPRVACCQQDNTFTLEFCDCPTDHEKKLVLANAMLLDLLYFEIGSKPMKVPQSSGSKGMKKQ